MRSIVNQVLDYFEEFDIKIFEVEIKKTFTHSITVKWEQDYVTCTRSLFEGETEIWSKLSNQYRLTRDLIRAKHGALTRDELSCQKP